MNSRKLFWEIYTILFAPFAARSALTILSMESAPSIYYHTLIAFGKGDGLIYYLSVASALVDVICLLPILLFTFNWRFLSPRLWQWFFALRIILNLTGHSYEFNFLRAMWNTDTAYAIQIIVAMMIFMAPSYVACFQYAFRPRNGKTKIP